MLSIFLTTGRSIGSAVERRDGMVIVYGRGLQEISPVAERLARARYLLETTCGCPIMIRPQAIKPASRISRCGTCAQSGRRFVIKRLILNQATDCFFL